MMRYWLGLVGLLMGGVAWADGDKLIIDAIDVEGGAATLISSGDGSGSRSEPGGPTT